MILHKIKTMLVQSDLFWFGITVIDSIHCCYGEGEREREREREITLDFACSVNTLSYKILRITVINKWWKFNMEPIQLSIIVSSLKICTYEVHTISFQTFFVWALLLIVHTWNSSPIRSNLQLQWTCCTVPITSGRPHGSTLVWACQWLSSQPLSYLQLSHNDSLWA